MSIFSIGLSGLNAAQNALNTTSNNISNVYTPGYNRELTLLSEARPGGGVKVADVQRQFNMYVAEQLNAANSRTGALDIYQNQISQIDNLLADTDSGISVMLQNFFSSLEDLVSAPSDPAARQGFLGAANTLAAQFRSFDRYLEDMDNTIGSQIKDEVGQINNMTRQLAQLNEEVVLAQARTGSAPNSLLNQRDKLVADLSQVLDVKLSVTQSSSYNLTIGNGQPLVAGTRSFNLEVVTSAADPSRVTVAYRDSANNLVQLRESSIQGGSLGGLLAFRSEALDETRGQLGRLAATIALAFNEQHAQGTDLNGDPGEDIFAIGQPRAYANDKNTGSASVSVTYDDATQLTGGDYTLRVTNAAAGEFSVQRTGGQAVAATLIGNQLTFGGVTVTVDDPLVLQDGDRFEVQTTRWAAKGMQVAISDVSEIAAGLGPASGDNENALAMQALQESELVGGNATFSQAFAAIVGEVGNRTNITQLNREAQQSLSDQLRAVQQSESGVNLDEEAANLIRYQQYYQANARVINTASTVLDTLLNLR